MSETDATKLIQLELSTGPDTRLWRNNVGTAWQGDSVTDSRGGVYIQHPRRVQYGLCVGSSDLIGLHMVTVTPDMVGKRIPVFTSIEVKAGRGVYREEQGAWRRMLEFFGARVGMAKTVEQARDVLNGEQF